MRRLEGRNAVVTGAANGIGRASALRFASEGANLAILDLEADGLESVAEEARRAGAKVVTIAGDCTNEEFLVDSFSKNLFRVRFCRRADEQCRPERARACLRILSVKV